MNTVRSLPTAAGMALMLCAVAVGQPKAMPVPLDIPPQRMQDALNAFAAQGGFQVIFAVSSVQDKISPKIQGRYTPEAALTVLLAGTSLSYEFIGDKAIAIRSADMRGDPTSHENPESQGARKSSFREPFHLAQVDQGAPGSSSPVAPGVGSESANRADTGAATVIEEIVVTAQHRTEKLRDVPMGITALTGDALDKRQDRSFEDYVALVPGLSLQQGSPGVNTLTLRGLNAGGVGSTVAVYVDDSPVDASSSLGNGSIFASNFDPWDMQRIEVLRGPQGTLYGASSEGGLIRFVTNAPDPAGFAGRAEVGGEGVAQGGKGWSGKLMVNAPLGTAAAFRVSAYSQALPGYVDDPILHRSDVNSAKKNGVRASLLLLPTSDLTIRLTAFKQEIKADGFAAVDVDNTTRQPVYGSFTHERDISEPTRYTYNHYNATVDWKLGWASALASTTYGNNSNRLFNDSSRAPFSPDQSVSQFASSQLGVPVGLDVLNQTELKKLTQELRLQSSSGGRLEWEVGGYFTRETVHLYQPNNIFYLSDDSLYGGRPGALALLTTNSYYKEWAGFGTVTYHVNPRIDVQIGGRWAHNTQSFLHTAQENLPPTSQSVESGVAAAGKFLYSFAPRWHLTDDLMAYARVASGYQPGGPNDIPPNTPPGLIPTQFQPDNTVNYEAGVRDLLFNQHLSIDVTAFRIDWSHVQIRAALNMGQNGSLGYTSNGGGATSQGVEWALGWTQLPDLTLSLTGAFIDAKLTTDAPAVGGVAGQRLPGSPRWNSSLDGEYGHDAFADYRAFVGGTWSYTGTEFTDFSATNTLKVPPVRLQGYATLDLRAGLQNGRWRFSLYAKNVTNTASIRFFSSSGTPLFPGTAFFNTPRTIGGTASFQF